MKEELGINEWLELIKEDKNLNNAYISVSQYIWLLEQENKALLTLINWAEECGFGFDNFTDDEYVKWEEFEKENYNMDYIESMIHYAKKYNKMQELQGSDSNE